jgi:hypothetical protein
MTIAELVSELSKLPQYARVAFVDPHSGIVRLQGVETKVALSAPSPDDTCRAAVALIYWVTTTKEN